MLKYYTLRSETSETFKQSQVPIDKEEEEKSKFIRIVQVFLKNNNLKEQKVFVEVIGVVFNAFVVICTQNIATNLS